MTGDEGLKYLSSNAIYSIPIPVGDGNYVTFIDIADMAAELLRRRESDRWIPVSERLPNECEECLLLNKNKSQFVGWLDESSLLMWFDTIEGYVSDDITHWRPLPEPPEST
jgi:hypothetical protein